MVFEKAIATVAICQVLMCDVVCLPVLHNLLFPSIIVHSLILRITHLASLHQSGLGPAASEDEMQLTKSTDRKIAGVCGGIAAWLGWSAASIRALFVIVSVFFLGIGGVLLYALLAWTMPPPRNFNLEDFRAQ
jgi:phage shock protein C